MGWRREATLKYRFQWTFPIAALAARSRTCCTSTGNHVFRSTDEGTSWEAISPDLTRNDPTKLEPSGGPITQDNTGAEYYCTIFAFAESPHAAGRPLGRLGRRPGPRLARRRQDLAERHAAAICPSGR